MTMHVAYWQWISIESSQLDEWCQSGHNMEWNRMERNGTEWRAKKRTIDWLTGPPERIHLFTQPT